MCLGVPGRITDTWQDETTDLPMARVDFGGVGKNVCLIYEPAAQLDDYVMVHVGFAISRIDEAEAQQTLDLLRQMGELEFDEPEIDNRGIGKPAVNLKTTELEGVP